MGYSTAFQVINVYVPVLFKQIVDYLHEQMPNIKITEKAEIILSTAFWMVIYCKKTIQKECLKYNFLCINWLVYKLSPDSIYRLASTVLQEARNAVFARIDQSFQRQLNKETFKHLLDLDLSYHKNRDLGAINQALSRGTRY